MNFENFKNDIINEENIPETKEISKSIERKREIPQSVKYALVAIAGYFAGKNAERQFDQTKEMIDAFKQGGSIVENTDVTPEEFGAKPYFVNHVDTNFEYQESLKLVDEILAKENSDISPENRDKLQQMRQTLSESLEILDDVLSNNQDK
jgi:hypothetical protein